MIRTILGFATFAMMTIQANAYTDWWRGKPPACDETEVLAKVLKEVAYGAPRVLGHHLAIETFDGIDEDATKAHGENWIDWRYCNAMVWLSNGESSEGVYRIEATKGFAPIDWNVEPCPPAYDRWRVYDACCRSIRP